MINNTMIIYCKIGDTCQKRTIHFPIDKIGIGNTDKYIDFLCSKLDELPDILTYSFIPGDEYKIPELYIYITEEAVDQIVDSHTDYNSLTSQMDRVNYYTKKHEIEAKYTAELALAKMKMLQGNTFSNYFNPCTQSYTMRMLERNPFTCYPNPCNQSYTMRTDQINYTESMLRNSNIPYGLEEHLY